MTSCVALAPPFNHTQNKASQLGKDFVTALATISHRPLCCSHSEDALCLHGLSILVKICCLLGMLLSILKMCIAFLFADLFVYLF